MHPCLIHKGPPQIIYWPSLTLDVQGKPVRVDALVRIGKRDPQWVVLEIGGRGQHTRTARELMLDMPVIPVSENDVQRKDFLPTLVARIQGALPRKAA